MTRFTSLMTAASTALMLTAPFASAQQPDSQQLTRVTFSAPVSLPGVTLPAGTYTFKLADSQVNRNVVQVFDRDQTRIFATIIAVPAERQRPADETVITFHEAAANAAPAVQYWFFPGEIRGQEFAYPKAQAAQIANAAHTSVLSIDAPTGDTDAMKTGTIGRVEPGSNASADTTDQAAPTASRQSAQTMPESRTPAQPSAPPAPSPSTAPAAQPATPSTTTEPAAVGTSGRAGTPASSAAEAPLPRTGSELPLLGLAGLLALGIAGGAFAVRRWIA